MADDCIFCKIARGDIFCAELYSTDTVLAFLDIAPVHKGHALVLPKAHHETLFDVPPDLWRDIMTAQQAVGKAIMQVTGAPGHERHDQLLPVGRTVGAPRPLAPHPAI